MNQQIKAMKAEAYLEPKGTFMMKLFLGNNFFFFAKNSIIDGPLGFKDAPENNDIFKEKPRRSKST